MVTLIVLMWLGLAMAVGAAARSRGRSFFGWFILACLFSPIVALILLMAFRQRHAGPSKNCQFCRSEIDRSATICPHCQRELSTPPNEIEAQIRILLRSRSRKKGRYEGGYAIALGFAVLILLAMAFSGRQLP